MRDIHESQRGNRFVLSYMPEDPIGDDLGRGGGVIQCLFFSSEGRAYYRQMVCQRERMSQTIVNLESEIRYLKTVKGANKNLREVRAKNKGAQGAD